jgi:hypothetical protein
VRKAADRVRRASLERETTPAGANAATGEFTRRRLENGVVALVRVRHGEGAELEAGFLDALGIEPVEVSVTAS